MNTTEPFNSESNNLFLEMSKSSMFIEESSTGDVLERCCCCTIKKIIMIPEMKMRERIKALFFNIYNAKF